MKGRSLKFFLPILTGLVLVFSAVLSSQLPAQASHSSPSPSPSHSPSPSPSPKPCKGDDEDEHEHHHSFLNFINVYAGDDKKPCPSPSPSPRPSPSPSPTPTPSPSTSPSSPSPSPSPSNPPIGGGPGGDPSSTGGSSTPTCPQNGPQQVDQVWFTDVKPGEVTVHWANKGDASGFHIAYGPSQNNLIWGVEVMDHNATQFTLQNLPGGDLWVAITAKSSADCGGPTSATFKVGGPQVLGATGVASNSLEFAAGFGLIILGLWQAQKGLARREVKV